MLTPREKSPLPEKISQVRIEPTTLHNAGQRAQHTTNELFRPPYIISQLKLLETAGLSRLKVLPHCTIHSLELAGSDLARLPRLPVLRRPPQMTEIGVRNPVKLDQ